MATRPHHQVVFASRYGGLRTKTLKAAAALWRAELLVDDAKLLRQLKSDGEAKEVWFGRRGTFDIISYFSVGFVTCLEWHARSRLVDLMLFRPRCIVAADVKNIAGLALSQMVAEGATIPHLLGAATNVSQARDYISIFDRVFKELEIHLNLEGLLRHTKTDIDLQKIDADTSLYAILEHLFTQRNRLVHEIDLATIGHFSIRDMWTLDEAIAFGTSIVSCIKLVEKQIREHSPEDFPNRLREDDTEEDECEKLSKRIDELEAEITEKIKASYADQADLWCEALWTHREGRRQELSFFGEAQFLRPVRHLDRRRSVQIELLKSRLAFLLLVNDEFY